MDKLGLGERLTRAREDAGMTEDGLARAVGLDRTAITRLEKGERSLDVPEIAAIAGVLGRPLAYLVDPPVSAAVSRRTDGALGHGTTRALDAQIEDFAADTRYLLMLGLLRSHERPADARTPRTHQAAEEMAISVRRRLALADGPVDDLGRACDRLGLHTYSAALGEGGPDGACVEIDDASASLGATVINGEAPAGRRRMTLAHELGHWLCGDAYDARSSADSERMLHSFAIHFLAPRAGVTAVWSAHAGWSDRDRALAVGAKYRLSWSATLGQLSNIRLIDQADYDTHRRDEPRSGDYVRLGLSWADELASPYLSPAFAAACVNGYVTARLTEHRAVELLRGTLSADGLPRVDPPTPGDLRRSFAGHGA